MHGKYDVEDGTFFGVTGSPFGRNDVYGTDEIDGVNGDVENRGFTGGLGVDVFQKSK